MEDNEPVRDIIAEALEEHQAGPVKKSNLLLALVSFASLWIILCLGFFIMALNTSMTLGFLSIAMILVLSTPAVGLTLFVIGYLRRYRFRLGKPVERLGVAILALSVLNIAGLLIARGNI